MEKTLNMRVIKRRRTLLRRRMLLVVLLFLMMVLGMALAGIGIYGISQKPAPIASADPPASSENMLKLAAFLPEYPSVARVISKPSDYPASLVDLFLRNQETLDYLVNYPNRALDNNIDISREAGSGEIPHFLQWDIRWGYAEYGGDMMGITGCGPTSLAMVAVGLTGREDFNPATIARYSMEMGYFSPESGTKWELMEDGAVALGLMSEELPLNERAIRVALESERPIICSMEPGDFTTTGHFIVLSGLSDSGGIEIKDSSSRARSARVWNYDELAGQIKNLWAFSKL